MKRRGCLCKLLWDVLYGFDSGKTFLLSTIKIWGSTVRKICYNFMFSYPFFLDTMIYLWLIYSLSRFCLICFFPGKNVQYIKISFHSSFYSVYLLFNDFISHSFPLFSSLFFFQLFFFSFLPYLLLQFCSKI